jgi:hypothetical protein
LGLTYADADVNGKPIDFTLRTGAAAAAGSIVVILRHALVLLVLHPVHKCRWSRCTDYLSVQVK